MMAGLMNSLVTRILAYVLLASLAVNGYLYLKHRLQVEKTQAPAKSETRLTEEVRTETRLKDGTVVVKVEKRDKATLSSVPARVKSHKSKYSVTYQRQMGVDARTRSLQDKSQAVILGLRVMDTPLWLEAGYVKSEQPTQPTIQVGIRLEL